MDGAERVFWEGHAGVDKIGFCSKRESYMRDIRRGIYYRKVITLELWAGSDLPSDIV